MPVYLSYKEFKVRQSKYCPKICSRFCFFVLRQQSQISLSFQNWLPQSIEKKGRLESWYSPSVVCPDGLSSLGRQLEMNFTLCFCLSPARSPPSLLIPPLSLILSLSLTHSLSFSRLSLFDSLCLVVYLSPSTTHFRFFLYLFLTMSV